MTSRRSFLRTAAAAGLAPAVIASAAKENSRRSDILSKIQRQDYKGLTKEDLPTPCLVLDHDMFEYNVQRMANHGKTTGINIRPHVKIHKCVDIAKRQIALGAIGLTVATCAEAELMSAAGCRNVFWTRQPVGKNNTLRAMALAKKDPTFIMVVDDPMIADRLEEAAAAMNTKANVAVDIFAGMARHGIEPGQPGLDLAQKVHGSRHLKFAGFMGYAGGAAHTRGFENRRKRSQAAVAGLVETANLAKASGLPVGFVSGGSTGTYNIDKEWGLTELECGSYIFMDTSYTHIGSKTNEKEYDDWKPSLTLMTTIVSKRHPNQVTIDAGNKALLRATDEVKNHEWLTIFQQGAEYGGLRWKDNAPRDLDLGNRMEIYTTNLDMTVNNYDKIYVAKGEQIVDVWPIMGRSGAAQR
jgi:D-serine deaminase-like pyridoxal phosphate-dependent protein